MRLVLLTLLGLCSALGPALAGPAPDPVLREEFRAPGGAVTSLELPGGPTVLLQPVPGMTAAAVVLAVPGGSAQDPAERGGTAHLLEHLVFRATPKFSAGRLPLELEGAGARSGARTTPGHTVFWEVVPAARLDLALAVQADRLQGLTFSLRDLEREREEVLAELARLQAQPGREAEAWLRRALRPEAPEEAVLPAGRPDEVQAIRPEDLRTLYERAYRRDRAVLALVGGFEPEAVQARLAELFPASAPPAAVPSPVAPPAGSPGTPGEPPASSGGTLMLAFPAPSVGAPDFPALALLEALLADGPASRLALALGGRARVVPDPDLADGVHRLALQLDPGASAADVEARVLRELARLGQEEVPPAELQLALHRARARFYRDWQDPARRGIALAVARSDRELEDLAALPERLGAVRAPALREAAGRLLAAARLRTFRPPAGDPVRPLDSGPGPGEARAGSDEGAPGPDGLQAPEAPFTRTRLDNGMTVLVWPDPSLPTVTLRGYLQGGALLDPSDRPGLTALAARLLGTGTEGRAGESFQGTLEERGARLRFRGDRQVIAVEGWCLAEDLPVLLQMLGEALRHPAPGPDALARARDEAVAEARRLESSPVEQALAAFMGALYPVGHPSARPAAGASLEPREALEHLRRVSRPDRLVLAFSGDTTEARVLAALRPGMTSWYAEGVPERPEVADAPWPEARVLRLHAPGPEALVLVGHPGPSRRDPDYVAFNLLNQVLGGSPESSRLALRIRDLEGIGSAASSRLVPMAGPVPWAAVLRVRPDKADRAVALVKEELKRLREEPLTKAEILQAAGALTGQLAVALAEPAARADLLASLEFHRLSQAWVEGMAGLYERLTPRELQATARARFRPDRLVVVIASPDTPPPVPEGSSAPDTPSTGPEGDASP